jgi:hypothetical protein
MDSSAKSHDNREWIVCYGNKGDAIYQDAAGAISAGMK